ncbi:MAG: hypothetical protein IK149_01610 [Oscillospiraceae bacterium]|nr:hypothetical protein [Oscillospiraceae bacterium]
MGIQSGNYALEISKNKKEPTASITISYRSPYYNDWLELITYIVHAGLPDQAANNRVLAESIMKCATQATVDMMNDLIGLGRALAEKMGELYDKLNDAEG